MSLEIAFVKNIIGDVSVVDGITNIQRDIKAGDELFLNDTITPSNSNANITVTIEGREDITLGFNDSLVLDESVVNLQSFSNEAILSSDTVEHYVSVHSLDFEGNILSENQEIDFSSLFSPEEEISQDATASLNIKDIIELPNSETKIFLDDTQEVSLNEVDWIKQDTKVVEDGHSFDVYAKNIDGHEVTTLLIEEDISVFYNHG